MGCAGSTPTYEGDDICAAIAGVWIPTRVEQWKKCPCPLESRLQTYRYEISPSGQVADLLYPAHAAKISAIAGKETVWEGWGTNSAPHGNPREFQARFELQPNGELHAKWGTLGIFGAVYYLVHVGDPRASGEGAVAVPDGGGGDAHECRRKLLTIIEFMGEWPEQYIEGTRHLAAKSDAELCQGFADFHAARHEGAQFPGISEGVKRQLVALLLETGFVGQVRAKLTGIPVVEPTLVSTDRSDDIRLSADPAQRLLRIEGTITGETPLNLASRAELAQFFPNGPRP